MMYYELGYFSIACLILTAAMSTWGVFSKHFDDSLLQRIGLSTIAFASIMRIPQKLENMYTPPELLFAQFGLVLFGVGTVYRFWSIGRHKPYRRHRGLSVHL